MNFGNRRLMARPSRLCTCTRSCWQQEQLRSSSNDHDREKSTQTGGVRLFFDLYGSGKRKRGEAIVGYDSPPPQWVQVVVAGILAESDGSDTEFTGLPESRLSEAVVAAPTETTPSPLHTLHVRASIM
jgi:hypothetical protein